MGRMGVCMSEQQWDMRDEDVAHLRGLAARLREIADGPVNKERLRQWYLHGDNKAGRPLLLTETDGGLHMVLPDFQPTCQAPWAQGQEWGLMSQLMHYEVIGDDFPIEPYVNVPWSITQSDFGVKSKYTHPETNGTRGAYHIDPMLEDLGAEFDRLQPRTFSVDREATLRGKAMLEQVYDGILGVRIRTNPWWTLGLTQTAITIIGLENLMLYMYDEPEPLHRLMAFLRDDRLAFIAWLERENLLCLNNENDYVGSGSMGYCHWLPQADWHPGQPVRTGDMWTLIESQETVGVGPELYGEFIYPYENAIAEHFGAVYYGCCEPVHTRWEVLRHMANLKRVSISPWCNEEFMAEAMGNQFGYSRKPNPSLISTETFDEETIRADIRHTLDVTKRHNCNVEFAMKDVHTLNGESDRLTRWVKIAREEIAAVYGTPVG